MEWFLKGMAATLIVSAFLLLVWTVTYMIFEPAILLESLERVMVVLGFPRWFIVSSWFLMTIGGMVFGIWFFIKGIPEILRKF